MSNIRKSLIVPVAVVTMAGGVIFATNQVSAKGMLDSHATLIQKLTEKFNLNEAEVQAVFSEVRDERRVQMQAQLETKLDEAIANGELTTQQKELILGKHEEMKANREDEETDWSELSPEERQLKSQEQRQMMQAWAEENDVDFKYFDQKQTDHRGMEIMKAHER